MTRVWVGVIAFAGGVAVGLWVADLYAQHKVVTGVDSFLQAVGLGGGAVQRAADAAVPVLVG